MRFVDWSKPLQLVKKSIQETKKYTNVWQQEIQIDGFEIGSFDWTTNDEANAYTSSNGLVIMPTLTNLTTTISNSQINDGYNLNLTTAGLCTSPRNASCATFSNSTTGNIINPVRSARLSTKLSKQIKYGRVEVTAKMPAGDWILSSVRLIPVNNTYGEWPRSGSIDIMQLRGNDKTYPVGGRDIFTSTLHWGVSRLADRFWKTTRSRQIRHTDFTKGFHTFGIEWTKDYIFTYHNGRIYSVLWVGFLQQSLWNLGQFSNNGTLHPNPWAGSGNNNAPFDQLFYLSLSVQVGATNGYFPDSRTHKPWIDASPRAAADFWGAADSWYPTWGNGEDRAMVVRNVKMWQEGKC
ncbi:hypothetical protein TWF102_007400 [Orbilia oligospora]|uniref:GH16 domain-containing protein n=2 Tax=Orbilia oligospora TaxID=2813651 RepID=A0A7C8NC16_ORBOL|nr:hypothetical protein TWF102_007400 [Orbilia oligospora]